MSTEATHNMNNKPIDPSINWESNGVLARAAHQGAVFSLYLAMHATSVAEPIRINTSASKEEDVTTRALQSLNHYRRPGIAAQEADWTAMSTLGNLMATDMENALLFQAMYPQPLAQTNDALRLDDDVINNTTLAAQKRLQAKYRSTMDEDNTMIYDVINSVEEHTNLFKEIEQQFA